MEALETKIRDEYVSFVSENHKRPHSIAQFMESLEGSTPDFHRYFQDFHELDKVIWKGYFEQTLQEIYKTEQELIESGQTPYDAEEKLKSVFYFLVEILKHEKDYVTFSFKNADNKVFTPSFLTFFQKNFEHFAQELILQGTDSNVIASRPIISDYYDNLIWGQILSILRYWVQDESPEFEKTDVAIEKGVTFVFDIMRRNVFDSTFDFVKFLILQK
ncbi:MAG: hypothetical protein ACI85I_000596 [Arenicella sp.]|jgi:hypothetical protein